MSLEEAKLNKEQNRRGKIDLEKLNAQLKKEMEEYKDSDNEMEEESEEALKKRE
jgi:hypothetical protein